MLLMSTTCDVMLCTVPTRLIIDSHAEGLGTDSVREVSTRHRETERAHAAKHVGEPWVATTRQLSDAKARAESHGFQPWLASPADSVLFVSDKHTPRASLAAEQAHAAHGGGPGRE